MIDFNLKNDKINFAIQIKVEESLLKQNTWISDQVGDDRNHKTCHSRVHICHSRVGGNPYKLTMATRWSPLHQKWEDTATPLQTQNL